MSSGFTRRKLLASAGVGGAALLGGSAVALLRNDDRDEALRAPQPRGAQVQQSLRQADPSEASA